MAKKNKTWKVYEVTIGERIDKIAEFDTKAEAVSWARENSDYSYLDDKNETPDYLVVSPKNDEVEDHDAAVYVGVTK